MATALWIKYKVGKPSTRPNWTEPDCQTLETVGHVAHLQDAIRILEDGSIRSSLIWDESCLRDTRTCVSWVSPNSWYQGSIYGNVRFQFDWKSLVKDKVFYWVEAMTQYRPTAVRLLITTKDYDNSRHLVKFDPTAGDGPLYRDGTKWYWNGNLTVELMVDDDLSIGECSTIEFEKHHPRLCSKGLCTDSDLNARQAASQFVALLLGRGMNSAKNLFTTEQKGAPKQTIAFDSGLGHLFFDLQDIKKYSATVRDEHVVDDLVASALVSYGLRKEKAARNLISLLKNQDEFQESVHRLTKRFLGFAWRD